jgi:SAM-dependent methyltransferase
MAQVTTGMRSILSVARVYQGLQDLVGGHGWRQYFVDTHVQPTKDDVLLDVGCGTGVIIEYLPADTQYIGVDLSSDYIEHAQSHHDRGTFICASVGDLEFMPVDPPTVVLAIGLLHHLDDEEVHKLFQDISRVMAEGSRLITGDPCLLKRTHPLARLLIRMDRGQNVRTPDAYRLLAERTFADVEVAVRSDLLRVPYDHAILTCRRT